MPQRSAYIAMQWNARRKSPLTLFGKRIYLVLRGGTKTALDDMQDFGSIVLSKDDKIQFA
jgi:hypothetical protein